MSWKWIEKKCCNKILRMSSSKENVFGLVENSVTQAYPTGFIQPNSIDKPGDEVSAVVIVGCVNGGILFFRF